jgi:diguanylate cyclase (GGDEF)-like protein
MKIKKLLRHSTLFKTVFATITTLLLVTIVIILSVSFTLLYKQQLNEIEDQMLQTTKIADQFITNTISTSLSSAYYISEQITVLPEDRIYSLFNHSAHSSKLFQDIVLYDLDGNVVEHYLKNSTMNIRGNNFNYRPFFQAIAYDKSPYYISDFFQTSTNKNVFAISVGVYDQHQQLSGVLSLGVNLTEINEFDQLNVLSLSKDSYVYMVDRQGTVLQHPNTSLIGQKIDTVTIPDQGSEHQNVSRMIHKNNTGESFVYYFSNKLTDWGIIGILPTQSIWKPIYQYMLILTGILLFLMLALLWFTMWMSAKFLYPLLQLTEELKKVKKEKAIPLDVQVHKDLQPLLKTYNNMLASIYQRNQWMKEQMHIDPLTGLYNRRYMNIVLNDLLILGKESQQPFSIIIFDIDHFKNFNDTLGHPQGDELLTDLGEQLLRFFRENDKVFRTGGEEFMVLLQNCDKEHGFARGKALREYIGSYPFEGRETQPNGQITISLGIASYPEDGEDIEELIRKADQACYYAKESGRNQVSLAK